MDPEAGVGRGHHGSATVDEVGDPRDAPAQGLCQPLDRGVHQPEPALAAETRGEVGQLAAHDLLTRR
jgi:hypothetical protein